MSTKTAWLARKLLRAARWGTLASATQGQPFASLVTPATAPDLSLLLLLSDLSEHTRHLRADPRCAVMVVGEAEDANPQTSPRVTVTGLAELVQADVATASARYLAQHPYAAMYAGFADFHLWRLRPLGALYVGGFGRAGRVRAADLMPAADAVAAVAAAEAAVIARANADHADVLGRIAGEVGERPGGQWRVVAADVDGCDLALGERVVRVAWSAPLATPDEVRRELAALAQAGRGR